MTEASNIFGFDLKPCYVCFGMSRLYHSCSYVLDRVTTHENELALDFYEVRNSIFIKKKHIYLF